MTDRPKTTYSEPTTTYSNTNSYSEPTYSNNSVAPIEVPLDKYAPKKTKSYSSSSTSSSRAVTSSTAIGKTYKVQLIAVEYHNPNNRRYDGIKNLGLSLNTEPIEGKDWVRVLLGSFKSEAEAKSVLENARKSGFDRAFLVEYQDGQRKRRIR